jgi:hypothetical protein
MQKKLQLIDTQTMIKQEKVKTDDVRRFTSSFKTRALLMTSKRFDEMSSLFTLVVESVLTMYVTLSSIRYRYPLSCVRAERN